MIPLNLINQHFSVFYVLKCGIPFTDTIIVLPHSSSCTSILYIDSHLRSLGHSIAHPNQFLLPWHIPARVAYPSLCVSSVFWPLSHPSLLSYEALSLRLTQISEFSNFTPRLLSATEVSPATQTGFGYGSNLSWACCSLLIPVAPYA